MLKLSLNKFISALALFGITSLAADATTLTIPYSFTAGTTILSSQVNSNFSTIQSTINGNIDATNVGPIGFYASQIIPTTIGQATFGGTNAYTFPTAGIVVGTSTYTPTALTLGNSSITTSSITSAGNVLAKNGVFSAPATFPIQLCPNATCSFVVSTTGAVSATSFTAATGAGNGLLIGTSPTVFLMDQPGSGISVAGVSCSLVRFSQLNTSSVGCLDTFGNFGVLSGFNVRGHTVPFDAQAPGGTTTEHIERGSFNVPGSTSVVFNFVVPFSQAPVCTTSYLDPSSNQGATTGGPYRTSINTSTFNVTATSSTQTGTLEFICVGN